MPAPGTIGLLQAYLTDIIDTGTPAERKAGIEALVEEIHIADEGLISVLRIPGQHTEGDNSAVRAMMRSVGRVGLEPTTGRL